MNELAASQVARSACSIVVVLALALVACGDDSDAASGSGGAGAASATSTASTSSSSPTPSSNGPGTGSGGDATGGGGGDPSSSSTGSGASTGSGGEGGGIGPSNPDCAPLPAPGGEVVQVTADQAGDLPGIAAGAAPGTTLVLAPGTYAIGATIQLTQAGVTLRSSTDVASDVVIDAAYGVNEAIAISASDVTVAHVTITRAVDHLIHVYPPGPGVDVLRPRFHGLRLIDGGEQFIKVNPIGGQEGWIDEGEVSCSTFLMTDEGRPHVEPCCGGCYTGGVDVHSGWGWSVHDNAFEGIHCAGAGLPEHAIHFWKGSRDSLVERNTIIDCGRGIGLGLEAGAGERIYDDAPAGGAQLAHYDGIVRGNVIFGNIPWFDTGIEIHEASAPIVVHNTVYATEADTGFFSSIDYRFESTTATIVNNVVQEISQRNDAVGDVHDNLLGATPDLFVDAAAGDLHLAASAAAAIDAAVARDDAGLDIDGEPRDGGSGPDLGADETH